MSFDEITLVNQIAAQERSIAGVKASFNYAANPDMLAANLLPAVVHFIPSFSAEPRGHFNLWKNELTLQSVCFVAPREAQGGKLRYLENEAIPYGAKWRAKFQDSSVINTLLTQVSGVKVFLIGGTYGAGGVLLTYAGIEYIGFVFTFSATSA